MIDAAAYFADLKAKLLTAFGPHLCYLGMQGSYLRGEATDGSDIDAMVILDSVTRADLERYRDVIRSMPYAVEPCGFLCSKADMAAWNPLELGQLRLSTRDVYGCLDDFLPLHTRKDDVHHLLRGVNDLYHALVHGCIYDDRAQRTEALPQYGKGLFFLMQLLHYLRTGDYCPTHALLAAALPEDDRAVLALTATLPSGKYGCEAAFDTLLPWCQRTMQELSRMA